MTSQKEDGIRATTHLLNEMIEEQKVHNLRLAREIIPKLTAEDILQPNDYPLLENSPHFRYEEGMLAGLQSARSAIAAYHCGVVV